MKIAVLGARGMVGQRVVAEAVSRGHFVTGVVRDVSQIPTVTKATNVEAIDVSDADALAGLLAGQDVAVCAVRPPDGDEEQLVGLTDRIVTAAAIAETRIVVVGGAASLRVPGSDHTVLTAPGFLPASVRPIALACQHQYERMLLEKDANWSYLCPPANLEPGDRTGQYRLGDDTLVCDSHGESKISIEDFAVALLDEAEQPSHLAKRFTVGY